MSANRERPLMVYDGDCRFCTRWIERWKAITGDRVEYRRSQDGPFEGIPTDACEQTVQFLGVDGSRTERARAVFDALATARSYGRVLAWAHRRVPGFGTVADAAYNVVARNRMAFSWLTRTLWGRDVRPPTYAIASAIFLRLLGLVYLIAFVSFGAQAEGLLGPNGILPVGEFVPHVREALGADACWQWPSLVLIGDSYVAMTVLTWGGIACAVLILLGVAQPLALTCAWIAHLSLVTAGQLFYGFQWDALLLEAGFLAIFMAGWSLRPGLVLRRPPALARFLLVWLLFRLMFASGVVKLTSGDPTWANLTALDYHYWTQPIPNPISWFAAQLPGWLQKFSCLVMFGLELVLPFFVFLPRRPRLIAFAGFLGLNLLIELTGNYGYFNLLTVAIAVLLIDDAVWPKFVCEKARAAARVRWNRWIVPPLAAAVFVLSWIPFSGAFRTRIDWWRPLASVYEVVAPFRSINGYGLFAVMTTERPEILIQGSMDGLNWKSYRFKYKPGPIDRPPPFVSPYMPRLDWQMWFAALGDVNQNPWLLHLMARLFDAEPDVLALLEDDPFDGGKPRFLRAMIDDYRFTTFADPADDWWKREPRGIYVPEIGREQLGR